MSDYIGKVIDRYRIDELLGQGGMASVFKAYDTRLDRYVAFKVIQSNYQDSDLFLKRFEREAKALAQLTHSNIVSVIDYGEVSGEPYLVMEYLTGGNLKEYMGEPLPYQQAAMILAPIARALQVAHSSQIIHRDIKPTNILMTESGNPMLSDFGIAKVFNPEGTSLTATGVGIGTPEYMAPELGRGEENDHRVDIYSLGVVFYELVTGRRPFYSDTPMGVIFKHATEPLPSPRDFVPDLPQKVVDVLIKALTKYPDDRYPDMASFADAIEALAFIKQEDHSGVREMLASPESENKTKIISRTDTAVTEILPVVDHPLPEKPSFSVPNRITSLTQRITRKKNLHWGWIVLGVFSLFIICGILSLVTFLLLPKFRQLGVGGADGFGIPVLSEELVEGKQNCGSEEVFCAGLVTDTRGLRDQAHNESIWQALGDAQRDLGVVIDYLESEDASDYSSHVNHFVNKKYDVILTVGWEMRDITAQAAENNPNVIFIGVDQYSPKMAQLSNYVGLVFPEKQGGYLAGFLAASLTRTGVVGAVLGPESDMAMQQYAEGFYKGAASVERPADVQIKYLHNHTANSPLAEVNEAITMVEVLIDQDADVVFTLNGKAGDAVLISLANHQRMGIGMDFDRYEGLTEARPALLSSVIKVISPGVYDLLTLIWVDQVPAEVYRGRIELAPYHDLDSMVPPPVKEQMQELLHDLNQESGEWTEWDEP